MVAGTSACFLGGVCSFWIGRRLGHSRLERIHWLHLSPASVKWPEQFFKRFGAKAVFIARFIPLFPPAIANLFAGMSKMPWRIYLFYDLTGSAVYTASYLLLGYFFGKRWKIIEAWMGTTALYLVLTVAVLILLDVIFRHPLSRKRIGSNKIVSCAAELKIFGHRVRLANQVQIYRVSMTGRKVVLPSQILIVEVEEQLAGNLKTFLGRSAVDVRIAPDADAAMVVLGSFAPDLVVLDDGLPGINGLRAYDKIVRSCPKPPRCVLITSDLTEAVAERARQQGVCQILCKPFSFAELQHAINASMSEMGDPVITSDRRVNERRRYLSPRHLNRRLTWTRRERQDANFPGLNVYPAKA